MMNDFTQKGKKKKRNNPKASNSLTNDPSGFQVGISPLQSVCLLC